MNHYDKSYIVYIIVYNQNIHEYPIITLNRLNSQIPQKVVMNSVSIFLGNFL